MMLACYPAVWRLCVAMLGLGLGLALAPIARACDGPGACSCAICTCCGHDEPGDPPAPAPPPPNPTLTTPGEDGVVDIAMINFTFVPQYVAVTPGTTIRWTNFDPADHNTISQDDFWDSGLMVEGDTFEFTAPEFFTVINYECTLHGGMFGQVEIVVPEPASGGLIAGIVAFTSLFTRRTRHARRAQAKSR
jgi:plastocyanin